MKKSDPLISVLMGVRYVSSDTSMLQRSVCSILRQTYSEWELLICDDGSSKKACSLLDKLAISDSRIRLIRDGNLFTLPQKLNACLKVSKGPWVARMDDDDFSDTERFDRQLAYLGKHKDIAFVGCNVRLRCGERLIGKWVFPEFPSVRDFYMTQPFIHPTLMFSRDALVSIGGYSEERNCILCEDYDLLLRLYAAGYQGANLQSTLFEYTVPEPKAKKRGFSYRINETVTRYHRFQELGCLPAAWPFVLKPLAVGMIPQRLLVKIKNFKIRRR